MEFVDGENVVEVEYVFGVFDCCEFGCFGGVYYLCWRVLVLQFGVQVFEFFEFVYLFVVGEVVDY